MTIERIMADLHEIAQVGEGVDLLNLYKGVPIVNKATFVRFEADAVTLKTQRPQLICLERDGRTIVLSDILQVALGAKVAALDQGEQTVTLDQLVITDRTVGDRMTVRVEPREQVAVELEVEAQKVSGTLADISINGVGVHVPGAPVPFRKKMTVHLIFQLPNGQIDSSGLVRYAKQEPDGVRVGIDFSEDVRLRAMVSRYINERRTEILGELGAA